MCLLYLILKIVYLEIPVNSICFFFRVLLWEKNYLGRGYYQELNKCEIRCFIQSQLCMKTRGDSVLLRAHYSKGMEQTFLYKQHLKMILFQITGHQKQPTKFF